MKNRKRDMKTGARSNRLHPRGAKFTSKEEIPMKRTFCQISLAVILSLALSGSALAFGVTDKDDPFASGKWLIGLSSAMDFGMGSDSYEPDDGDEVETDVINFNFGAAGGYFVLQGWEIGPVLRYDYERTTDEDDNITGVSDYLVGIQTGYYYATPVPVHPFVNLELGYAGRSVNYEPDEGDETSDSAGGFAMRPSLGAAFFFTRAVALTPSLYYQYTSLSGTDDMSGDEFDYDETISRFGLQIGIIGIL